jgi:nitrate reductase gamma subunit
MFRTGWILAGTIAFVLSGTAAYPQETDASSSASQAKTAPAPVAPAGSHSSKVPQWTRVHRVDDFITGDDLSAGIVRADKDAPIVVFSHSLHARGGVSCEQCHHGGVKGWEAPACATCHKGAQAVGIMHEACITCHQEKGKGPVTCNVCHTARQSSAAGIVRFQLYDTLRGPLFIAAWVIFALGFAWRIIQFTRMTRRIGSVPPMPKPVPTAHDASFLMKGRSGIGRLLFRVRRRVKSTVFGRNPVMGVVSLVFHLLLVAAPLFLPAHAILFRESFRWNLPTLPEQLVDKLTLGLLAIGMFFLIRRMVFPRVRSLTTVRDYLVLLLVAAPFVTAYMAYHQWLDYRTMLATHMLVGEIVIALIPFTKLGHMPFLIVSRFFASGEYSWKPGNRRW